MSFYFTRNNGQVFRCNLQCLRCAGNTKAGRRCARNTCKYLPLCFQHLKATGLQVKPSNIPNAGDGLFTTRQRARHELIGVYEGEVLSNHALIQRYGTHAAPFAFRPKKDYNIDAACRRCTTAYINDPRGSQFTANVRFVISFHNDTTRVTVRTTKAIQANQELFIPYDNFYWQGTHGTYITKRWKFR